MGRLSNLTRRQAKWLAVGFYVWLALAAVSGYLGYHLIRHDLIGIALGFMFMGTLVLVVGMPIALVFDLRRGVFTRDQ